jgi:hypothetical protein
MSPTDLTTRLSRPQQRIPLVAIVVVLALIGAGLVGVLARVMRTPGVVSRVTIVNKSPYGVDIDLRDRDDAGRLVLGRALPRDDTVRREVLDMGDRWIFSFSRSGLQAGDVELSRATLERNDWRVTVPSSVVQRLERAGEQPFPEEGSR